VLLLVNAASGAIVKEVPLPLSLPPPAGGGAAAPAAFAAIKLAAAANALYVTAPVVRRRGGGGGGGGPTAPGAPAGFPPPRAAHTLVTARVRVDTLAPVWTSVVTSAVAPFGLLAGVAAAPAGNRLVVVVDVQLGAAGAANVTLVGTTDAAARPPATVTVGTAGGGRADPLVLALNPRTGALTAAAAAHTPGDDVTGLSGAFVGLTADGTVVAAGAFDTNRFAPAAGPSVVSWPAWATVGGGGGGGGAAPAGQRAGYERGIEGEGAPGEAWPDVVRGGADAPAGA